MSNGKANDQIINKLSELADKYDKDARIDESRYNEASVRQGFILPLLRTLGWNVDDPNEVYPEDPIKNVGIADFSLKIESHPMVYVETKKFTESLDGKRADGKSYVDQALEYAWKHPTAAISWAILTNFKELRLYNAKEHHLIFSVEYQKFASEFDAKLRYLTKESVRDGNIGELYSLISGREIDKEFLRDLLAWRVALASDIRRNNRSLTIEQIEEATQLVLDRLILIRIAEDRGKIPRAWLRRRYDEWEKATLNKQRLPFLKRLTDAFVEFESIYNTELFKPHFADNLTVTNETLRDLMAFASTRKSNGKETEWLGVYGYDFATFTSDVLGTTYESYLGHDLVMENGAVKATPNKKSLQSGGIYYTRPFVVDFIISRALDEYLGASRNAKFKQIRVLDFACGSGTFLTKALDRLRRYYVEDAIASGNSLASRPDPRIYDYGELPDFDPNKVILLNNLYGVDVDLQAVEVTKLNLWIKSLKKWTVGEKLLPELVQNVRHGNTILSRSPEEIEAAIGASGLEESLGKDWRTQLISKQPFDYSTAFSAVVQGGGFDLVVGNPPYNNMRDKELRVEQLYCEQFQKDIFRGNSDILYYFIRKGVDLLRESGRLGLIVARYFMKSDEGDAIREYILANTKIRYVVDTRNVQLFGKANVLTTIVVLEKNLISQEREKNRIKVVNVTRWTKDNASLFRHIEANANRTSFSDEFIDVFEFDQSRLNSEPWMLEPVNVDVLVKKIATGCWALENLCDVGVGFVTGLNEARLDSAVSDVNARKFGVFVVSAEEAGQLGLERQLLVKLAPGGDIHRYLVDYSGSLLVKTDRNTEIDDFPKIERHLSRFRKQLEARDAMPACMWFGLSLLKNRELFEEYDEKIIVAAYATGNKFALDIGRQFHIINTGYAIVMKKEAPVDIRYILAILNSRMMEFYHKKKFKLKREGYYEYFKRNLDKLPIKRVDTSSRAHQRLVELASRITDLNQRVKDAMDNYRKAVNSVPHQYTPLNAYYMQPDSYEIANKQPVISANEEGEMNEFSVATEDDTITIGGKWKDEEGSSTEGNLLSFKLKNADVRLFLYYSIKAFIQDTSLTKIYGRGNLLRTALSKIKIPRFTVNHKENVSHIHAVIEELQRTSPVPATLEDLEENIVKADLETENEVRELYGLNADDIALMQKYSES